MKISKEMLQELCWEEEVENFKVVKNELIDSSRWSLIYDQVIQDVETGKYYVTSYSVGATECQEESPYEYEPDEIEVKEVFPVEKVITVYE